MLIHTQQGVGLIELLIGIALLALLMALGVPQYGTYLANARIRATAESIASGLSTARAEAVNRNNPVQFVLTNDEPSEASVNALTISTSGTNWVVREWQPAVGNYAFIEGKFGAAGTGSLASTVQVTSSSPDATYDGRTTFKGFGGTFTTGGNITISITNPAGGACDQEGGTRGPMRCLNIVISPGGQILTCDPAVPATALTDTRRCPT
jgi:type IV fimbrial biogenesis protein FimT